MAPRIRHLLHIFIQHQQRLFVLKKKSFFPRDPLVPPSFCNCQVGQMHPPEKLEVNIFQLGIGVQSDLSAVGIDTIVNNPSVGRNLSGE